MSEPKPSLSEVAREIYWMPALELESAKVSQALERAGIDPHEERERKRLLNLVTALNRLRTEDEVCERLAEVSDFLESARDVAGDDASIEELIELAQELKDEFEQEDDDA